VESVNTIVKVDVPDCVGVPAMVPDKVSRVRPEGNAPVSAHLYGLTPPIPVSVAWYGTPGWPFGNPPEVICSADVTNVTADEAELVGFAALVASTLTLAGEGRAVGAE
jgi:hypothetical protein